MYLIIDRIAEAMLYLCVQISQPLALLVVVMRFEVQKFSHLVQIENVSIFLPT